MHSGILEHDLSAVRSQFSPAEVLEHAGAGKVKIRFPDDPAEREFLATLAVGSGELPLCGQQVLVVGMDAESLYVIGIISDPRNAARAAEAVVRQPLPGGGYAEMPSAGAEACVRIYSPEHDLVLQYNPRTRQTRIHADCGGLEVLAADSDILFRAGGQIRMEANSVAIEACREVDIKVDDPARGTMSKLCLRSSNADLTAPEVDITADKCKLAADQTDMKGTSLTGELEHIKVKSNRAEFTTGTLVSRCKNVYENVEELCQLCAGRLRMMIQSTWHTRSQNTYLNTREDFKVKADQIHLG